jgi:hypothetical protein
MYRVDRVLAIVVGSLALAACSSSSEFLNLSALKSGPIMDTVRFESEPPGAEAKVSSGQSCKTPCALALPSEQPVTVTYTLAGYQPETDQLEVITSPGEPPHLRPNPVLAELTAAPPPPKPTKKPARKHPAHKPVASKPAAKPAPQAAAKPAPRTASAPAPAAIVAPEPAAPAAASPWPAPPPPAQQR